MERESFEDDEVARLLNERFVAIKVDREERPDIDQVYMSVCQAMTGQGGWPLTVLMTPDQQPFFAGTYFPKEGRYGLPGLLTLLRKAADEWAAKREAVERTGTYIVSQLKPHLEKSTAGDTDQGLADDAVRHLMESFDSEYGGFGDAPKFPTPHQLMFLLRFAKRFDRPDCLNAVVTTLESMMQGGIYDHIGGGFSRYSTDREWLVPHFEKMLYDNALLVIALVEAYQVTNNESFAAHAKDVLSYVLRDMTDPEGGFYCAEDADSEGVEGKFYLWTPEEVAFVLGPEFAPRLCRWYAITEFGNFEGANIPHHIGRSMASFAKAEGMDEAAWAAQLQEANKKLFAHREQRVHPHKDDKVLTSWNGLMIAALSLAGRVFQEPVYTEAAQRAAAFVDQRLTTQDGRLLARYRGGHAAVPGTIDDYAFLTWGLTELYETTFEPTVLKQAVRLQTELLARFWDEEGGGFYFTSSDAESLLARPKEIYDGALPSGNSVAAYNLARLARMTGNTAFDKAADETLRAFAGDVAHYAAGHAFYLSALLLTLGRNSEVVVSGWTGDESTLRILDRLQRRFLPDTVVLFRDESDPSALCAAAPFTQGQGAVDETATVYLCENFACSLPTHDIEQVIATLE